MKADDLKKILMTAAIAVLAVAVIARTPLAPYVDGSKGPFSGPPAK